MMFNKKYDSYKCLICAALCEAFTFLMENICVDFEGMANSGYTDGHKLRSTHS